MFGDGSSRAIRVALPCYATVLVVHFNLKLWVPYINPTSYDLTIGRPMRGGSQFALRLKGKHPSSRTLRATLQTFNGVLNR